MTLVNKWVFISDVDYWKSGKVVDDLGEGHYLLLVDKLKESANPVAKTYEIFGLHRYMLMSSENDWVGISAFDTEEDLRQYIEWIDAPSENKKEKVVKLVPKEQ